MLEHEFHGVQIIVATERDVDQRIDNCLFRLFRSLPKSRVYRLLRKGGIRVNKKRVDPEYRLKIEDQIRIPPLGLIKKEPQAISLNSWQKEWLAEAIIEETPDWLVLNKPSGVSVHAGTDTQVGVIETLRLARPDLGFVELAHRLDKETSGALLIAKKPSVLKEFHRLFRERESIQKTYRVVVKGIWPKRINRVDTPVEGKPSLTTFQVVQTVGAVTELTAILHTGRQHQIRLHCQSAGFPVVGDTKYGDFTFNREFAKRTGQKRMFLHAEILTFTWQGQKYQVEASLDSAWKFV